LKVPIFFTMENQDKNRIVEAIKTYVNAEFIRNVIKADNAGKPGVYCWRNLITGECYVGSGKDLYIRISQYFQRSKLVGNRPIIEAIRDLTSKFFALEILCYCTVEELKQMEQEWMDRINPSYNIAKFAYSLKGCCTEETRAKLSKSITQWHKNNPRSAEARENLRKKAMDRGGRPVRVLNVLTNETWDFKTLRKAGKFIGNLTGPAVAIGIKRNSLMNKIYRVSDLKK